MTQSTRWTMADRTGGYQPTHSTRILPKSIEPISSSIPKMLRYTEWVFLFMLVLRFGFRAGLLMLNRPLGFEIGTGDYIMLSVAATLAVLSGFFPIHRPMWQRRAYILVEILFLLVSRTFTGWGLNLFLYLVLVKSCFLLRWRDVISATVITGISWQLSFAWYLSQKMSVPTEELRQAFEESLLYPSHLIILDTIVNSSVLYIAASLLVILLCLLVLAERDSRKKAAALSQEVETLAADLERTRIAREIHDSLGHTLTTLSMQLEVSQALYTQDPQNSFQALNQAELLAKQSLQEIRRAVSTLRHGNFNLSDAIADLVSQMESAHNQRGCPLEIKTDINLPHLPLQTSRQLFLIIKEGLINVQKHSQASFVEIWGEHKLEKITAGISDNGIGFSPKMSATGFGLRGIEERVQLLAGQVEIYSTVGQGTSIQLTFPQQ